MLTEITEETYEEFKKNPKAVLIVSKKGCPPCELLYNEAKAVAQGKRDVVFAEVYYSHMGLQNMKNDWKAFNPEEFARVPQTFIYKDGVVVAQKEGALEKDEISALVKYHFPKDLMKSSD